jgi:hypothetical protein
MSQVKPPSFQWYPKDCDTDERVKLMSHAEFGFYVRCLNHAWLNDGLPGSIDLIAILLNTKPAYARRLWETVSKCFQLKNDRFVNSKQEETRAKSNQFRSQQKIKANSKWSHSKDKLLKTIDNADAVAFSDDSGSALPEENSRQCFPIASPIAKEPPISPVRPKAKELPSLITSGWDLFIERYPNPVKVDSASQAWISLVASGEITESNVTEVLAGLQRWIDSAQWARDDGKYIPAPVTFLVGNDQHTGRLWKDHPPPSEEVKASRQVRYSSEGRDAYAIWVKPKDWVQPEDPEEDVKH